MTFSKDYLKTLQTAFESNPINFQHIEDVSNLAKEFWYGMDAQIGMDCILNS